MCHSVFVLGIMRIGGRNEVAVRKFCLEVGSVSE